MNLFYPRQRSTPVNVSFETNPKSKNGLDTGSTKIVSRYSSTLVLSFLIPRRTFALQSPLLQSIFGGCSNEFTRQLEAYPDDVSAVDHEKRTMLHAAAFVGMSGRVIMSLRVRYFSV